MFFSKIINNLPFWVRYLYRIFKNKPIDVSMIEYKDEYKDEYNYVKKHRYSGALPYEWADHFQSKGCEVYKEGDNYYSLINVGGSYEKMIPLYWAKETYTNIGRQLRGLYMEQDERSPHRYFSHSVFVDEGTIFFDIGAAEGLITLQNIEKIKMAYVFECDDRLTEKLLLTFKPYEDKIKIINKYVSKFDDDNNTTLQYYIKNHINDKILLKIDIEGMETEVIPYALGEYMGNDNISFTCCTYHKQKDASELKKVFEDYGYNTEFSNGYMLIDNPLGFRKGVIRAWK